MARVGRNAFQIDLMPLIQLFERSQTAAQRGATRAIKDIKNDWVREAVDVAPLDTGNLRRQISGKVEGAGLDQRVEIEANAMTSKQFNYAYYIHEGHMADAGKKLRHPGTVEEFLSEPADRRESEWEKMLEREIREELNRAGW